MKKNSESIQVRAGSRTYFIDIENTSTGKQYLKITESRFKGEGQERERASIIVFQENVRKFVDAITSAAVHLE